MLDPEVRVAIEQSDPAALRAGMVPESGDIAAWAAGRRAARAAATQRTSRPESVRVVEKLISGVDDHNQVSIRLYIPADRAVPGPVFMWLYGGAFMFGSLDEWDAQYVGLARDHRVIVVGVDYRKAPDHPYPAAVNDCYAALVWIASNARDLGIDESRIVVGGQSAGSTFTVALTLLARDRGGPSIAYQLPMFAALDDRLTTHSSRAIDHPLIVNAKQYERVWRIYRGPNAPTQVSPYFAPARSADLAGLPPAYMCVGEVDPMRDENIDYAKRLMAAGVSTELHVFAGAPHGIGGPAPDGLLARRYRSEMREALARALTKRGPIQEGSARRRSDRADANLDDSIDPELRDAMEKTDLLKILAATMIPKSGDVAAWATKRRAAAPTYLPDLPDLDVADRRIAGPRDNPALGIRTYRKRSLTSRDAPALLWIYGGAFMFGSLDSSAAMYAQIARDVDCVVVGVDYRKAPEQPFPAALDDCYAALTWIAANASTLGIDPTRVAVGGMSAGGTLSAAVALLARDRGGPMLALQLPMYAALDDRLVTPSSRDIRDERIVHSDQYARAWQHYLGPARDGLVSAYAAPARAASLERLPPAYMFVGELDPMRDENIEYAARLMAAGVTTELHVYPGAFHGFSNLAPEASVSRRAQSEWIGALRRALIGPKHAAELVRG